MVSVVQLCLSLFFVRLGANNCPGVGMVRDVGGTPKTIKFSYLAVIFTYVEYYIYVHVEL